MNGVHDMGGMHGLGPVVRDENEPVFHTEWERRLFAITVAAGYLGKWNLDMTRYAREQMPAAEYLASTYYEHWLHGLELLLVEKGLLTREEVEARARARGAGEGRARPSEPPAGVNVLKAGQVTARLLRGDSARGVGDVPARFRPGDGVLTRKINPIGHTRLPRYARGRRGVVDRDHGVFVFPDTHAMGLGKKPQHVYSVRFAASELWGPEASPRHVVYVDVWDDYLEPA